MMKKKPSAASAPTSASAAAQLLVSRGRSRRAVATDESIEFFSALRDCESDPPVSAQPGQRLADDGSGKVRSSSGGDGDGDGELLSAEIGKHDYDWLLTPPATPRRSPGTSGEATGSAAALNRLARATSASYAKNNSPLISLTRRGNGINPTSRLARSSSAAHTSVNTTATAAPSRGLSHVRTMSSASSSVSSIVGGARNGSGSSTPLGSAVTTPRTPPAHARSTVAANARSRPRDKTDARLQVSSAASFTATRQRKAPSSSSGLSSAAPASARRPRSTIGASSPRSTTVTSSSQQAEELTTIRGANAVARSRLAGSTAQGASSYAPHGVRPGIKPRGPVSAPGAKQCYGNGMAAASMASQRWRSSMSPSPSPSPAVAAGRESAPRGELLAKRLSMNGDSLRINVEKVTPRRTAGLGASAALPSGLTRTASRKPANIDAKRTGKENVDDDGRKCKVDVRHGGAAPAPYLKPTVHHRSIRATVSRSSRPGSMDATYDGGSGSIAAGGQCTSEKKKGKPAAAAAARLTKETEAPFASTRYDAMLSREDPKNLTWLNGCGVVDDGSGGAGLVECLLEEPFDVPIL